MLWITHLLCVRGYVSFSLYASLKRLPDTNAAVKRQLEQFGLADVATTVAGSLPSSSKRRLTVALATLGLPPAVLILDSPTQGTCDG